MVNDKGVAGSGKGCSREPALRVVKEIEEGGGDAVASFNDVSRAEGAGRVVELALERYGTVDIRCLGSDYYRYPNGRICQNRPIRQDYLDEAVWNHVVQLLENPGLIRAEIQRRILKIQDSSLMKRRREIVEKEIIRVTKGIEKFLDGYQEGLFELEELRKRIPHLRKRQQTLKSELDAMESANSSQQNFLRLAKNMEDFLGRLRKSAEAMAASERQKTFRLVVKEILIDLETIKIKHSIPFTGGKAGSGTLETTKMSSYLLRSGSNYAKAQMVESLGVRFGSDTQITPEMIAETYEKITRMDGAKGFHSGTEAVIAALHTQK